MKSSTRWALAAAVIVVLGSVYHGTTMFDGSDNALEMEQAKKATATAIVYGLAAVWLLKLIIGPMIEKKAETEE